MISVGNKTIAYDNIGNPTSYLGATLTWEGRELKSYETSEQKFEYMYDENGMRYRTTVTNKEDNSVGYLDYVWVDSKLISISFTSDELNQTVKYLYNDFDEPVGFVSTREDGSIDTYYYLKNAQGDITHIVSAAGKKMVTFTYDVFGKRTVTYQANGSTTPGQIELLTQMRADLLNPFAYRGYCYDYDMGMYYLQSRYYDPEVGRFINADDTDYLNATGTVLGCNLFAYCENDGVNYIDATGTWAKDVHRGYYTKQEDGTRLIGGIYKYTGVAGVYMPYYTAKDNKNRVYYGTYLWAIQCGIKPDYAKIIADECNEVDNLAKGKSWMPVIGDQSWHFNIYWGTNKTDSRIINSNKMISEAKKYFDKGNIDEGLVYLGMSLHPIQDIFAHTRDVCRVHRQFVIRNNKYGGRVLTLVEIWYHPHDELVDNARKRTNQLYHTAIQTKKILSDFAKKYPFLCY